MTATIRVECPSCGVTINAPKEAAGSTGKCPRCKSDVFVPMPDDGFDEVVGAAIADSTPPLMSTPPTSGAASRGVAGKYPALVTYAGISAGCGWVCIVVAAIGCMLGCFNLLLAIDPGSSSRVSLEGALMLIGYSISTGLGGLACLVTAELIRLAIDIEKNTRGEGQGG